MYNEVSGIFQEFSEHKKFGTLLFANHWKGAISLRTSIHSGWQPQDPSSGIQTGTMWQADAKQPSLPPAQACIQFP